MLHLYLLRHGKSDWEALSGSDHDRPLAPRGRRAARRVGRLRRRRVRGIARSDRAVISTCRLLRRCWPRLGPKPAE